jgi:hypothetical protein
MKIDHAAAATNFDTDTLAVHSAIYRASYDETRDAIKSATAEATRIFIYRAAPATEYVAVNVPVYTAIRQAAQKAAS